MKKLSVQKWNETLPVGEIKRPRARDTPEDVKSGRKGAVAHVMDPIRAEPTVVIVNYNCY